MADEKEEHAEWPVTIPKDPTTQMETKSKGIRRVWSYFEQVCRRTWVRVLAILQIMTSKVLMFERKARKVAADDPRKVIHGVKVGIALTLVSLFYYTRPLYDCAGNNSIWAVITVVMVFEFTVGACLYKGFNRAMATVCAAALGVGIDWIASKTGEELKPIILSASVFLFGSVATFSRFIPAIKTRFEYGAVIFILTFSMVTVSGYRVDELFKMAEQRALTVTIGICICLLVCILVRPVWSGQELHLLVSRNMDKLADSLEGYVELYLRKEGTAGGDDSQSTKLQGYKSVLSAQASENSMASLARWEPPHGHFGFRHPWSQYLNVGAAMRHCACCIEALDGCIKSETIQGPTHMKYHYLGNACMRLGTSSSIVFKELSSSLKFMSKSCRVGLLMGEMKDAVKDVKYAMELFATQLMIPAANAPVIGQTMETKQQFAVEASIKQLMETMPAIAVASLLIEISERIDGVFHAVDTLADLACFDCPDVTDVEGQQCCSPATQTLQKDVIKVPQEISLCLADPGITK